jgi:hypothetical protein
VKTAEAIRVQAKQYHNIDVSRDTVARALASAGYVCRVKPKKPMLTAAHQRKRLAWTREHAKWTIEDWKKVVWSDETSFQILNSAGREYVWRKKEDALKQANVKQTKKFGGGKIFVWSCITWEGVGYSCKIDSTLDSELYCEILNGELMDSLKYYKLDKKKIVFQQDNDPKHTSQRAKETIEDLGLSLMAWPAQSPDLNPMEHYWNHVDSQLKDKKVLVGSLEQLWEAAQEVINVENRDLCRKLISTMPERVIDVIRAKGGHTRW